MPVAKGERRGRAAKTVRIVRQVGQHGIVSLKPLQRQALPALPPTDQRRIYWFLAFVHDKKTKPA
ncbi:hypothetical protein HMPREF9080_00027, partial [Cardiobacterium valvarum F0432]